MIGASVMSADSQVGTPFVDLCALVTGASPGIGRSIAEALSRGGARARRDDRAQRGATPKPASSPSFAANSSDWTSWCMSLALFSWAISDKRAFPISISSSL